MGIVWGIMLLGWGDVLKPNSGTPEPIGFYSSGCISGAQSLPSEGIGFQVMRTSRNRFYGHPSTLQLIQKMGSTLHSMNSGLLIGDISQPRGGPMTFGHASHQMGLDVDIWFWTHPEQNQRTLTAEERETIQNVSMLDMNGKVDPKKFTDEQITKLKIAATDPGVERIFVNPAIKSYLCAKIQQNDSEWLRILRPWKGHHEHFHVRLACPTDAKDCIKQEPQPLGTGCDELFSDAEKPVEKLSFPTRCESVLKDKDGTDFEIKF